MIDSASSRRVILHVAWAAGLASLLAAPHFLAAHRRGAASIPLAMSNTTLDEYYYLDRVYSCFRGRWANGVSFIFERANDPYLQPNLTESMAAAALRPFRGQPAVLAAVGALVFLFLAGAALLWAFKQWSPTLAQAGGGALLTCLLLGPWLHRTIQPQANYFVYALAAGLLYSIWAAETPGAKRAAALGVLLGAAPYLWFIYWFYLTTWTGLLLAFALLRKEKKRAAALALAFGVAAVLWLPYIAHNLRLHQLPYYADLLYSNGFLHDRFPSIMRSIKLFLVAAVLLPLAAREQRAFFAMALLAGLLLFNQQAVSGLLPPEMDFHLWRVLALPLAACAASGLSRLRFLEGRWALVQVPLAALLLFQQKQAYVQGNARHDARLDAYTGAFAWLDSNARPSDAVAAEITPSLIIPFVTRQDVLLYGWQYIVVPQPERWQRYHQFLELYQLPERDARAYLVSHHYAAFGLGADMAIGRERVKRAILGLVRHPGRASLRAVLSINPSDQLTHYERMLERLPADFHAPAVPFRADYLVYGPVEREFFPKFDARKDRRLAPVFDDGKVQIYRAASDPRAAAARP